MIEQALLDGLGLLVNSLSLAPPPKLVGVIEPVDASELPALVVSLEQNRRLANGLGERALLVTDGALPWQSEIKLANPVLVTDPSFSLLSPDRRTLNLPHGGLVRANAATGPLSNTDIQVRINGAATTDFTVDPLVGALTFAAPLPATGIVQVNYFLGQWERRIVRSQGVLRLSVLAADAPTVLGLSDRILSAIGDSSSPVVQGLSQFSVAEIGSIGPADPPLANARRRLVRFAFEFEQEINVPDASGGIIQRVPVQAFVN
jgi:hypothetical protein